MPFKDKVSLTLRGQWQAEETSFKSSTLYHCKLGDGELSRVYRFGSRHCGVDVNDPLTDVS